MITDARAAIRESGNLIEWAAEHPNLIRFQIAG